MLRGANYLNDKVKASLVAYGGLARSLVRSASRNAILTTGRPPPQVRASSAAFELAGVDVFDVPQPATHIASHPRSFLRRVRACLCVCGAH